METRSEYIESLIPFVGEEYAKRMWDQRMAEEAETKALKERLGLI